MALSRTWYNSLVDDDGSNTVGTIWDKAAVDHLMDDVDLEIARLDTNIAAVPSAAGSSTVTTTGTIATLPIPSGTGTLVIYMNNASAATIHGIAAGLNGQRLTLYAIGAGVVNLAYFSASAGATTQRLVNVAGTAPTPIALAGSATYVYDAGSAFWRLIAHEQGAWITPTFSAGHFTASAGSWTVDSGDVFAMAYMLRGKTLTVAVALNTTTVVSGPGAELRIGNGQWGGFSAAARYVMNTSKITDNGTAAVGYLQAPTGGTYLQTFRDMTGTAAWSASTNNTYIQGQITFEVA